MSGFCIKCRAQVDVIDAVVVQRKNISNPVYWGKCRACGTVVYRIGQPG
jgi:hypothetical protein